MLRIYFFLDGMIPITDTVDVKTTAQHSTETTQTTFGKQFNVKVEP